MHQRYSKSEIATHNLQPTSGKMKAERVVTLKTERTKHEGEHANCNLHFSKAFIHELHVQVSNVYTCDYIDWCYALYHISNSTCFQKHPM